MNKVFDSSLKLDLVIVFGYGILIQSTQWFKDFLDCKSKLDS